MEVIESDKRSRLLRHRIKDDRKKIMKQAPRPNAIKIAELPCKLIDILLCSESKLKMIILSSLWFVHGIIFIYSHFQNKIFITMEFWKFTLLNKNYHFAELFYSLQFVL